MAFISWYTEKKKSHGQWCPEPVWASRNNEKKKEKSPVLQVMIDQTRTGKQIVGVKKSKSNEFTLTVEGESQILP